MADTYSFKDLYLVDYRPGQGEMINYRNSRRRKGAMESVGCNKILKFKEWNKSE